MLLKIATSCGRSVILTLSATTVPMAPPMTMPPSTSSKVTICGRSSVAPMAIAMPAMAIQLPWRAVSGEASPRIPRMKQIAATR